MMAAHLIQLGQRHVALAKLDDHTIDEDHTSLVAITLWKEDWPQQWPEIIKNPAAHIRNVQGSEHFVGLWGKSYRQGRSPTTPNGATSIQMHGTIKTAQLQTFLAGTGLNGIWVTPKDKNGALSNDWKLIWFEPGFDIAKLKVASIQTPGAAGIIRIKQRHAIRVAKTSFKDAWEHLYPSTPVPKQIETPRTFKIDGLPFGATAAMIEAWMQHVQWPGRPLRATGPRAWIIGAGQDPPQGQQVFNGLPLLIKELTAKPTATSPIIAGPKSKPLAQVAQAPWSAHNPDPWARWIGTNPSDPQPARSTAGPTETRLTAQDQKLSEFEQTMKQLKAAQQEQQITLEKMQQETKATRSYIDTSINSLRQEIDHSFTQALQAQSTHIDTGMAELKQLILSTKRKERDDDMT